MENKDTLKEFLSEQGIEVIVENSKFSFHNSADKHVENLIKFHRRVIDYEFCFQLALKNSAGKDVTNYELWKKRAMLLKEELNINDKYFDNILEKAEKALRVINQSNYNQLIDRASRRKEIILGNSSVKNIYFSDSKLFIKDINKIEFNMIENDFIKYILKEKKKKKNNNYKRLVTLFLEGEGLFDDSRKYIEGMINYPRESMKFISSFYINDCKDLKLLKDSLENLTKIDYIGMI